LLIELATRPEHGRRRATHHRHQEPSIRQSLKLVRDCRERGLADERNLGLFGFETSKKKISFCLLKTLGNPPAASTFPSAESPT